MQKNIRSQSFYSDDASQSLVRYLETNEERLGLKDSILHYNFPLFKNVDEEVQYPSLTIISPVHGIHIFQCESKSRRQIDHDSIIKTDEGLSQIYSSILGKLIKIKNLRKDRNNLIFRISAAIYIPLIDQSDLQNILSNVDHENPIICDNSGVDKLLELDRDNNDTDIISEDLLNEILAILEGSKGIIKPKIRNISEGDADTKGGILAHLEAEIANFDRHQKYAAITQLEGPQRIRGLAGSGKTIVLAMKAALIHLENPDASILYTFNTKSLYAYIKRLITRFYRQHEDSDPDWDKIHILHAWGGSSVQGVYYKTCMYNNVQPLSLDEAKSLSKDPFDFVCTDLIDRRKGKLEKIYDYVLIDEAQDFKPSFYQLCRQIVRNDCIVWGYDELQNILNVKIQSTIDTFKNDKYGYAGINLAELQSQHPEIDNDIVLPKSYRSPKEILVLAHAIGFGIYNSRIIQMLENTEHWGDLGYEVLQGDCQEGDQMTIRRPDKNSPLTISNKQKPDELIKYHVASDMDDEAQWVCESIRHNINYEKLNPEDILVVCIDDRYVGKYFRKVSDNLKNMGIKSNNVLTGIYKTEFFIEGCVTLSTVYKAKGNEAALVYVIGVDTFHAQKDSRIARNKLFTAFTRSKAWLTITGMGERTNTLIKEIKMALSKMPNLEFVYPNIEQMEVFQRDLPPINAKKAILREEYQKLIAKAEREGLSIEDLRSS